MSRESPAGRGAPPARSDRPPRAANPIPAPPSSAPRRRAACRRIFAAICSTISGSDLPARRVPRPDSAAAPAQPVEREPRDMRVSAPRRRELGPERDHHESPADPAGDRSKPQSSSDVGSAQCTSSQTSEHAAGALPIARSDPTQRAEHAFTLLLPAHLMRRIPPAARDRQQRGEQRHERATSSPRPRQHRLELRELLLRVVAAREIRRALDMRDHRLQRTVQSMRRAE